MDFAKLLFQITIKMPFTSIFIGRWRESNYPLGYLFSWQPYSWQKSTSSQSCLNKVGQGILKGEVSLYCWPPVRLIWNQLYDNWQLLFLFAKQSNSKPVKQEVNSTVILPPLVFPGLGIDLFVNKARGVGAPYFLFILCDVATICD